MPTFRRILPVLCFLVLVPVAGAQPLDVRMRVRQLPLLMQDEVLWLARCVYSESNRAHEQRLVAWVVRNRVETGYRGTTYRQVVLKPRQFSAFNRNTPRRRQLMNLGLQTNTKAWRQALGVALDVYHASPAERPFPKTTRHFYSPVSMKGRRMPKWAEGHEPLSATRLGLDGRRFQFFDGLDEGLSPTAPAAVPPRLASDVSAAPTDVPRSIRPRTRLRSRGFSGRIPRPVRPSRKN